MRRVATVAWLLAVGLVSAAGTAEGLERLPAVLHVHSDLSTGDLSLEQLTAMAEKQGIGALLLTENYLLRVEYGLPPFRGLYDTESYEKIYGKSLDDLEKEWRVSLQEK